MTSPVAGTLSTDDGPVWLYAGTLIDGTSSAVSYAAHVVYDREQILFVGREGKTPPRSVVRPGQDSPDAEAPLHTLLPGLVDAHTHLYLEGGELDEEKRKQHRQRSPTELLADALQRLDMLAQLGIAGVRDAGDRDGVGLALSRGSRTLHGSESRPHVDSPGAALHRAGRYGSFMGFPVENCASLEACVGERIAAGADRIKIIASGIVDFERALVPGVPQFSAADISQIVRAAKALGRQTFAHASGKEGIASAIDGGVDSVEHGYFVTDDQLAQMRDAEIAWVPTFAPLQAQLDHASSIGWSDAVTANLRAILEQHAESVRRARVLGVTIAAGSDAGSPGVPHGVGLLSELESLERAGMSLVEVINAATGVSSDRFAYSARFGKIETGYRSRFILSDHQPLESVANLRKPRLVVFDGRVYETSEASVRGL
ncbi:MAG: amidohydrolase [Gemmatimonadetes bacterium]|nr:amidohydrolase [Gemmatimonadota bacterium]